MSVHVPAEVFATKPWVVILGAGGRWTATLAWPALIHWDVRVEFLHQLLNLSNMLVYCTLHQGWFAALEPVDLLIRGAVYMSEGMISVISIWEKQSKQGTSMGNFLNHEPELCVELGHLALEQQSKPRVVLQHCCRCPLCVVSLSHGPKTQARAWNVGTKEVKPKWNLQNMHVLCIHLTSLAAPEVSYWSYFGFSFLIIPSRGVRESNTVRLISFRVRNLISERNRN